MKWIVIMVEYYGEREEFIGVLFVCLKEETPGLAVWVGVIIAAALNRGVFVVVYGGLSNGLIDDDVDDDTLY